MRIDKCAESFYLIRNVKLRLRQSTNVKICKDNINSFSSIYVPSKFRYEMLIVSWFHSNTFFFDQLDVGFFKTLLQILFI